MSATAPTKAKSGNASTRGDPTGHPDLFFRKEDRRDGARGCLVITSDHVCSLNVVAEALCSGATVRVGDDTYYVVEFTTGLHRNAGPGGRTADGLKRIRAGRFSRS